MENIKEKIQDDLTESVRKSNEVARTTLRMLSAAILNKEKEKRYKISKEEPDLSEEELTKKSVLTDEEIVEVVFSEVKKRKEAIESFEKGKREDLVGKEKAELEVLQAYMPEQLSEEDIRKLTKEAVEKIGAEGMKDIGKVMGEIMPKVKGKADGNLVSRIIKELLSTEAE